MPNKTLRDIATEIGINVNTLKSRIYRAEMAGNAKLKSDSGNSLKNVNV